jgi:hypothetical protein
MNVADKECRNCQTRKIPQDLNGPLYFPSLQLHQWGDSRNMSARFPFLKRDYEIPVSPQMTLRLLTHKNPQLLACIAAAIVTTVSCMSATGAPPSPHPNVERRPTSSSPSRIRPATARYPDPRYRPPVDFTELKAVASQVAKTTGREIHWRLALGKDPGPLATIRGGLNDCTILIHPVAARKLPPNTWAFIFGHEFAHLVENLGNHSNNNPANEWKADIAGARYAMAAGYRIESFLGWVLTEPNQDTKSHGSLRDRVNAIATHFNVPLNTIQAQEKRYVKYRASK